MSRTVSAARDASARRFAVREIAGSVKLSGAQVWTSTANTGVSGAAPWSSSAWFKPSTNTGAAAAAYGVVTHFGAAGGGAGTAFLPSTVDNAGLLCARIGGVSSTTPRRSPSRDWQHVAATYDGATLRFYRNGVESGTVAGVANITDGKFRIGGDGASSYLSGHVAEVRFWDVELTAEQIADVCFDGALPVDPIIRYDMTDASGNTITDSSGNGNHATTAAGVWSTVVPSAARTVSPARSYGSEAAYQAMVEADAPLYYWKLDEASGNFAPTLGAITMNATAMAYRVPGPFGDGAGAARFNGTSSYAAAASALALSSHQRVVFECLIRTPYSTTAAKAIAELSVNVNSNAGSFLTTWQGGWNGTNPRPFVATRGNVGLNYTEYALMQHDRWNHVAFVFDYAQAAADEPLMYVNGVLRARNGAFSLSQANNGTFGNYVLYLGSRAGTSLFGNQDMSHVAVYGGADMTAARILAHAQEAMAYRAPS